MAKEAATCGGGHDAGLPADIAPLAGQDAAAKATHEAHLRAPIRHLCLRERTGRGGHGRWGVGSC